MLVKPWFQMSNKHSSQLSSLLRPSLGYEPKDNDARYTEDVPLEAYRRCIIAD